MKIELAPLLWVLFLVGIFILTYILNKKTPKPEGCENLISKAGCAGCRQFSCGHHPDRKEKE
ncbi:MAG: hypothetical protein Q4D53_07330 [Leptotrichiaceae bacterium]|nr:hypothetical protein [Leptotrichiaceae bacterium]